MQAPLYPELILPHSGNGDPFDLIVAADDPKRGWFGF